MAATTLISAKGAFAANEMVQTAGSPLGPFYPIERLAEDDFDLTWIKGHKKRALGDVIEVSGRVLNRYGNPVSGAKLELWQANAAGRYAHAGDPSEQPLDPNFQGFASLRTGDKGEWRIITVKPAEYDSPIGRRSPHIHFDISGKSHRLPAQMYFAEDAAANARDMLYQQLGEAALTSVAQQHSPGKYRWDIVLMEG